MEMIELNDVLPHSQWEGNWTFYGDAQHEGFPPNTEYVVFEYYCSNPDCHCQRLTADVKEIGADGRAHKNSLAIIDYDWSSKEAQCSPTLNEKSPQTNIAMDILKVYKKFIHHPDYIARIENHYARVKKITAEKSRHKNKAEPKKTQIGRNDLCPCGSNKKYKKCCLTNELSQDN